MHLSTRDWLATVLVGAALVLYAAWLIGMEMPLFSDAAAVAVGVLVAGIAASASAVVPGFAELLRGSRPYMMMASALGVVALVAGLWAIWAKEPIALAALVVATLVLWAMSTWRHVESASTAA